MGVSWFPCDNCGNVTNDHIENTRCGACDGSICYRCMDACRIRKGIYGCDACRDDKITDTDKQAMINFLLEQTKWQSMDKLRDHLRNIGKLPKRKKDFTRYAEEEEEEEKDEEEEEAEEKDEPEPKRRKIQH